MPRGYSSDTLLLWITKKNQKEADFLEEEGGRVFACLILVDNACGRPILL